MTNKELTTLIKLLKKHGVKHYRSPELSLELDLQHAPVRYSEEAKLVPVSEPAVPTDMDMLFWSSQQLPEDKLTE